MNWIANRREWMKSSVMAGIGLGLGRFSLAAPQSPSVVKLGANENPYGPSPAALTVMREAASRGNRYVGDDDYSELAALIAEREGLTPDHVVLGAGSGAVLCMAAAAFGLDGAEWVAPDPTFPQMLRYAERLGARVHRVSLDQDHAHDLAAMERRVTSAVRLVYVCNPNNPTGTIVRADRLRPFCEETSVRALVFVDEAYDEYVESPEYGSMIPLVREGRNIIVSRTFSKIYGLAGMRIGYGLARPDVATRLRQFRMGALNVVGVRAAIASYQDRSFVARSRRLNTEARKLFCRELERLRLPYVESHANFVWLRFGPDLRTAPVTLARRGIYISFRPAPLKGDWTRISIGTVAEMSRLAVELGDISRSA